MKPIEWRKMEEAMADMSRSLWKQYKEYKDRGFSRRQAFELTKMFLTTILQKVLLAGVLGHKDE